MTVAAPTDFVIVPTRLDPAVQRRLVEVHARRSEVDRQSREIEHRRCVMSLSRPNTDARMVLLAGLPVTACQFGSLDDADDPAPG